MSYIFIGLDFTSATNTRFVWMVLESMDFPNKQDAFGGKYRDWLLTLRAEREPLSIKEDWRDMDR